MNDKLRELMELAEQFKDADFHTGKWGNGQQDMSNAVNVFCDAWETTVAEDVPEEVAAFIAAACNFVRSEEFRELVRDAERYRWLRDSQTEYGVSAQYKDAGKLIFYVRLHGYGEAASDVDTAIDAAIAATEGE